MLTDESLHDESALQIILIDSNVSFTLPNTNNCILLHENIESHKILVIDVLIIKSDKT